MIYFSPYLEQLVRIGQESFYYRNPVGFSAVLDMYRTGHFHLPEGKFISSKLCSLTFNIHKKKDQQIRYTNEH